jgi:putative CocE/NonD family hydrolase
MTLMSRLAAWLSKLPPAETYEVDVEKNIQIPMPDGVVLLADHYAPRHLGRRPTLLMRSPYTARTKGGWVNRLFAERGFQVLVQSSRGAEGSGGQLDPFRQEQDDTIATLAWLSQQNWFNGELVAYGASYPGFTAWSLASSAGSRVKALSAQITSADFRSMIYPGDALALEVFLGWISIIDTQESFLDYFANAVSGTRRRKTVMSHLPLGEMDKVAFGKSYPFWQEWLTHEQPEDPWWSPADFRGAASQITAPTHLLGGWYDFMLPSLLRNYATLERAGRRPYLTIGPWTHFDAAASITGGREAMIWLREHALGDTRLREEPVRIYVVGANEWRDLPTFPPTSMKPQRWYLQPEGVLAPTFPPASEPDRYRYDPGDPTPSVGSAGRFLGTGPARQDNRALEARPDVLTFTSAELSHDLEVIGPVWAELFVRSSLEYTDFFVRITDVEPSGKSMNVCDGLQRLAPNRPVPQADGCLKVKIELWPMAYRFHRRHRLRIQVSSGAFPRWNRNLGSGEPLVSATTMRVAEQQVYHDPDHPSAVILPLC